MRRSVDLVIAFRATRKTSLSHSQTRKDAQKAQQQYSRLIETLTYSGLHAVGRRGESLGHLLIFISCPKNLLDNLVRRERHADFLSGLPVTPVSVGATIGPLSPADRIRLVHSYITSMPTDGGLGITPDSSDWDCVESILPLHDKDFNESWVKSWTPKHLASVSVGKIRDEFGDAVAYYFAFLSSYTYFLIFPASLGLLAYFLLEPYSPLYSILVCIWSVVFVEWWRIHERILSLRFGTRGSFRVEKRRTQYKPGLTWWNKDFRSLSSIPVILLFATILALLLTGIFVLEAFVTQLYEGPGKQLITFMPTILFIALVPRVLAIYHMLARRLTIWENHAHQSTYTASLTLKTFTLSAIVAYLGLGLSAFVYVPFGEGVMCHIQVLLFAGSQSGGARWHLPFRKLSDNLWAYFIGNPMPVYTHPDLSANATADAGEKPTHIFQRTKISWDIDTQRARQKLNPARLRDQMFAYTVTNQIIGFFIEVGLPFVLRAIEKFRQNGKTHTTNAKSKLGGHVNTAGTSSIVSSGIGSSGVSTSLQVQTGGSGSINASPLIKKRVVFEDERERGGVEERDFLDAVREETALPEYDLFVDYSEMVTQFGYVAAWSTIWPLASVMAILNNFLELRSDAFKMTVHHRRPIPVRTDTIGPWLDALTFLTWLAALTNASLVYLFSPASEKIFSRSSVLEKAHEGLMAAATAESNIVQEVPNANGGSIAAIETLLLRALLIALIASHGYILLRVAIRHIVEQVWWRERSEVKEREREEKNVRKRFLKGLGVEKGEGTGTKHREVSETIGGQPGDQQRELLNGFWNHDDGIEEIERIFRES
ncbi:hypothetical protein AMATHDRAFT_73446 [Amanita thiersii Skay4041]|uniref:DUF590-domain-containing protein n=1 Tax=Amanita thiersii Skay4041 TaxID=703135 RepID=A0A2A9NZ43_9AGAR|nr:hypothetical protein AMATHDRAFT_73446 [Amanita thiersii Skay4041]